VTGPEGGGHSRCPQSFGTKQQTIKDLLQLCHVEAFIDPRRTLSLASCRTTTGSAATCSRHEGESAWGGVRHARDPLSRHLNRKFSRALSLIYM
jgi:hypothetical protein